MPVISYTLPELKKQAGTENSEAEHHLERNIWWCMSSTLQAEVLKLIKRTV